MSTQRSTRNFAVVDGKFDLVLGAGGIKGYAHLGFLKAIEERKIAVGDIVGVSIGSLVAAFYTSGYTPEEIDHILSGVLDQLDSRLLARVLVLFFKPHKLLTNGKDLVALFQGLVVQYKLAPRDNLKLVAYNFRKRKPVVFQGTGYNLSYALAASCAVPLVMLPVWYRHDDAIGREHGGNYLFDGGVYNPCPTEFCLRRAIASSPGLARRLPRERLQLSDLFFHLLEMGASRVKDLLAGQAGEQDILVETGLPCVATLNFHAGRKICRKMIEHGYARTKDRLDHASRRGLVA